ncbi:hypothetical protein JJB07_05515 [Tumebacillus sp. ITR2]|uniref:Uncharacterized protein n=1 Tax=Tumebacillus amylolyticus TaxID=2801339 RepID=A0ABS1J7B2_9BACL|nr:hypothetical protein [Tumebacillus amylolyticus]MBL0386107.1 hypothetical protein [Tumebacillus amylolyticus]
MEWKATNSGVLIHQRCKAPYLLGCLLPHTLIRPNRLLPTTLEAHATFANGEPALELHISVTDPENRTHRMHIVLSYLTHQDFLLALMEASTLYLLTGTQHPVFLDQRVHDGGVAIEVNETARQQILRPVMMKRHA